MANNRIGIREFVELTVRTGDLNPITSNSNNTAIIGSQIHRKLQAAHRESDYEKEVYLKTAVTVNDEDYQLEGRADGVWTDDTGLTVEEIKPVRAHGKRPHKIQKTAIGRKHVFMAIYFVNNGIWIKQQSRWFMSRPAPTQSAVSVKSKVPPSWLMISLIYLKNFATGSNYVVISSNDATPPSTSLIFHFRNSELVNMS